MKSYSISPICPVSEWGPGHGGAEEAARLTTPASGHRRVDQEEKPAASEATRAARLCRIVGTISPLQRQQLLKAQLRESISRLAQRFNGKRIAQKDKQW